MKCQQYLKKLFIKSLEFYQRIISPLLGNRCRFYPSCSEYSKMSFSKYGIAKALVRTISRLLRCHPLCEGGIDFP